MQTSEVTCGQTTITSHKDDSVNTLCPQFNFQLQPTLKPTPGGDFSLVELYLLKKHYYVVGRKEFNGNTSLQVKVHYLSFWLEVFTLGFFLYTVDSPLALD